MNNSDGKVDHSMRSSATCPACSSNKLRQFNGELALHFPGPESPYKPIVWAFPEVLICLDCGFAVFNLEEDALKEARNTYAVDGRSDTDDLARAV